jgi:hypothetical protein
MATQTCFHNQTADMNHLWFESHKTLVMNMCIEFNAVERLDELTKKFLGKPLKLKKLKDPDKPKRTRSAFFYFSEEQRPRLMDKVRKGGGKVNIGNISKQLGSMWKALSPKKREKYDTMNKKDKARYQDEMEAYKN